MNPVLHTEALQSVKGDPLTELLAQNLREMIVRVSIIHPHKCFLIFKLAIHIQQDLMIRTLKDPQDDGNTWVQKFSTVALTASYKQIT
jgi:hypothetical protein